MNLTDKDTELLIAAAQRQDRLIAPPDGLSARARRAALLRLVRASAAKEVNVADEELAWRRDGEALIGLQLTTPDLSSVQLIGPGVEQVKRDIPRATKRAMVIEVLQRADGARISDLTKVTGWLPHTVRAALTGLRKSGFMIETVRGANGAIYRIEGSTDRAER